MSRYDGSPPADRTETRCRLRWEVDEPDSVVVVATGTGDEIIGLVCAGAARGGDPVTAWELYSINVVGDHHGTGVADDLLAAAVGERSAVVWTLEHNIQAQSFYRRHGFAARGVSRLHDGTGLPEIQMVRLARTEAPPGEPAVAGVSRLGG